MVEEANSDCWPWDNCMKQKDSTLRLTTVFARNSIRPLSHEVTCPQHMRISYCIVGLEQHSHPGASRCFGATSIAVIVLRFHVLYNGGFFFCGNEKIKNGDSWNRNRDSRHLLVQVS